MKPKIWFNGQKWLLRYAYEPRMFSLFGADKDQRARIYFDSKQTVSFDTQEKALKLLEILYRTGSYPRELRRTCYHNLKMCPTCHRHETIPIYKSQESKYAADFAA